MQSCATTRIAESSRRQPGRSSGLCWTTPTCRRARSSARWTRAPPAASRLPSLTTWSPRMETRPPTVARILIAVGFAISCFGLALFLWLAFGGPTPLKAEGYRFTVPFDEATQLAQESDVRISGVSVGKVKVIDLSDSGDADATIELDSRLRADPRRHARHPAPKDASRRDLRRAVARAATRRDAAAGGRLATARPGVGRRAARRDLPRLRSEDPRCVPGVDAGPGRVTARSRRRLLGCDGEPAVVRGQRRSPAATARQPGRGAVGLRAQYRRGFRGALGARGSVARSDRELGSRGAHDR